MIKEKEERLFDSWKERFSEESNAVFVTDGVVDETAWLNASTKVVYLLKEVNGGDENWDERDYLRRYNTEPGYIATHSQTITNLMRWQYGIHHEGKKTWTEIEAALKDTTVQDQVLSELCLVNVKKTAGGGLVDWGSFEQYFASDTNREYLREQLSFYQPDYVVCGGTAYHLSCLYGFAYSDWAETSRGVRYLKRGKTVYIDYCHPNNRGPKNLICFGLTDAIREIKENIE